MPHGLSDVCQSSQDDTPSSVMLQEDLGTPSTSHLPGYPLFIAVDVLSLIS